MEHYELDLDDDTWVLNRHSEDSIYAIEVKESKDINDIFLAMFKDRASRGRGSTVKIG
jgi:hypothetical protein